MLSNSVIQNLRCEVTDIAQVMLNLKRLHKYIVR